MTHAFLASVVKTLIKALFGSLRVRIDKASFHENFLNFLISCFVTFVKNDTSFFVFATYKPCPTKTKRTILKVVTAYSQK